MLKYIDLPHVSVYKRRWVRRIMIVVTTPWALAHAVHDTFVGAAYWWKQP